MKQHITPQQLSQLSNKRKERLREWWKYHKKRGDLFSITDEGYRNPLSENTEEIYIVDGWDSNFEKEIFKEKHIKNLLPLLSIGQMIELLNNYNINVQISDTENSLISLTDNARWLIHNTTIIKSLNKLYTDGGTGELCDALWSACVEILNRE